MRLWSLHPALLDRAALVAAWREGLLAQKVLSGATAGYRHHPQLQRFREGGSPGPLIATFLDELAKQARTRGYRFDVSRIVAAPAPPGSLTVTSGQLDLEWAHLRRKVARRDPDWLPRLAAPRPHPLFTVVDGPVESWERARIDDLDA